MDLWGALNTLGRAYVYPPSTLVFWLLVFAALAAARYAYARFVPRRGTLVSFEDLSSERQNRADASRVLTRSVVDLLHNPEPVRMAGLHMDIMPGIDEPGFGGLQPDIGTQLVDGFVPSDRPMKIGTVEITLRDLVVLASRLFSRSYESNLAGWVKETGDRVVAFASFKDRRNAKRSGTWRVERIGTGIRDQAIADLAAKVLVGTGNSKFTNSWRSFRSFQQAMNMRQSAEGREHPDKLASARVHLEEAVIHDPSHWVARFHFALMLCRDGEARTALKHFEMLEQVVKRAWPHVAAQLGRSSTAARGAECDRIDPNDLTFKNVVTHLKEFPECAFLILFNKAIARVNLHDQVSEKPLTDLENIAGLRPENGAQTFESPYSEIAVELKPEVRVELSLYALSAQAGLLAGTSAREPRCSTLYLKDLLEKIDALCAQEQYQHWRSLQTSRAVALTSLAGALLSEGDVDGAHDRLLSALAAEPHFIEAQLQLAELYIQYPLHRDATERARCLLERVIELRPSCRRARTLLANLRDDASADPWQDVRSGLGRAAHGGVTR